MSIKHGVELLIESMEITELAEAIQMMRTEEDKKKLILILLGAQS